MFNSAPMIFLTLCLHCTSLLGFVHSVKPIIRTSYTSENQINSLHQTHAITHNQRFKGAKALNAVRLDSLLSLRGGSSAIPGDLVSGSIEWCASIASPAALVAGFVFGSMYDNTGSDCHKAKKGDSKTVIFFKRFYSALLVSSFALQIVSIFVTTLTGTMLYSLADTTAHLRTLNTTPLSALGFLKENFELEYLTTRITFLQGLINWLGAIAIDFGIPNRSGSLRKMDKATSACLCIIILMIFSFYNGRAIFYDNYLHMLGRWAKLLFKQFYGNKSLGVIPMILIPGSFYALFLAYDALTTPPDDE